jgi:hypothetical protein
VVALARRDVCLCYMGSQGTGVFAAVGTRPGGSAAGGGFGSAAQSMAPRDDMIQWTRAGHSPTPLRMINGSHGPRRPSPKGQRRRICGASRRADGARVRARHRRVTKILVNTTSSWANSIFSFESPKPSNTKVVE